MVLNIMCSFISGNTNAFVWLLQMRILISWRITFNVLVMLEKLTWTNGVWDVRGDFFYFFAPASTINGSFFFEHGYKVGNKEAGFCKDTQIGSDKCERSLERLSHQETRHQFSHGAYESSLAVTNPSCLEPIWPFPTTQCCSRWPLQGNWSWDQRICFLHLCSKWARSNLQAQSL